MKPAFVITYDHLEDKEVVVSIVPVKEPVPRVYPFKLYDDDGVLYFTGFSTVSFSEMDGDTAFTPLDQYGAAYGCTYMEVFENNEWSQL